MKKPLVSVIIPTYNNGRLIEKCIKSILNQSFKNFELIVIDDCSKDDTLEVFKKVKNKRLKFFKTPKNSGSAIARNIGIKNSHGEYVFFIDGDCIADKNWIKEGLKVFEKEKCLGVEGKIYYVSKNYKPTAIDDIVENLEGNQFMTANMAYLRTILIKVKLFDPKLIRMQDRDLAFKILKYGKIVFYPKMEIYHQKFKLNFRKRLKVYKECAKTRILLFKRYNDKNQIRFRVYHPLNLFGLFFPPAIFGALFLHKYKSLEDFKTLLWIYPTVFVERISLWKTCIKERVFLI